MIKKPQVVSRFLVEENHQKTVLNSILLVCVISVQNILSATTDIIFLLSNRSATVSGNSIY